MSSKDRLYDVIVWGATGFTGRLVVEYLYRKYGLDGELKWAIAGRNQGKLKSVAASIGDDRLPRLIADSRDRSSLDLIVKKAKVICTTVGPYALYGSDLVASCVDNSTDYCDLTGEVQWMRKMIDRHHEKAANNGVRIVHTCGFDSIPSDMGVFYFQNQLKKRHGSYAQHIKCRVKSMKGGFSGGTYASLSNVMQEAAEDPSIMKILNHPYGLNPRNEMSGEDRPDLRKVIYDRHLKTWISPFVMAVINTKVVRRSHALSGYPYGKAFRYDEAVMTGKGLGGRLKSLGGAAMLGILSAGKPGGLLKKAVDAFMPNPGDGPSAEERENGYFNILFAAIMEDGTTHRMKVTGDMDPGYGSTSKMLGESAVCLAVDQPTGIAGILTPSTAMGQALVDRLQSNAGVKFTMLD